MKTWNQFAALRPELAEPGRALLYQVGVGLGYLATTRPDGGPRVHPMCPVMTGAGLFAFIVPSPKQRDLLRDGRSRCTRSRVRTTRMRSRARGAHASRAIRGCDPSSARSSWRNGAELHVPAPSEDDVLFEFLLGSCLLTRTTGHGDPIPAHTVVARRMTLALTTAPSDPRVSR